MSSKMNDVGCEMHVFTERFQFQECTATYWQASSTELADRRSDGNGQRMSFTFTDADYIKSYIILPLTTTCEPNIFQLPASIEGTVPVTSEHGITQSIHVPHHIVA